MFDIGFSELLLVSVIGLIVLGPERLPVAVKTVSFWITRLRSLTASVQNELSQELKLHALQDSLKQAEQAGLQNLTQELKVSTGELRQVVQAIKPSYHSHGNTNPHAEDQHVLSEDPVMVQLVPAQPASVKQSHDALMPEDQAPAQVAMKNTTMALNPISASPKVFVSDQPSDDC